MLCLDCRHLSNKPSHVNPHPPSSPAVPPQSPDTGLEKSVKKGARLQTIHHIYLTCPAVLKRPRLSLTPDTVIDVCP